jgi:isopenicillin N synthase-like dioxygenase
MQYWDALEGFSKRLLPAFAVALDLAPDFFDEAFEDAQCVLRLSHFPPAVYQDNQFGLGPHTDANFFTVLPYRMSRGCISARPAAAGSRHRAFQGL